MKELSFSELCQFTEKQWHATEVADAHKYTLYGGSRGGGKSRWLRWYLLRRLFIFAGRGLRGVNVMLACEDYPSLTDRQISKIQVEFPLWLGELKSTKDKGLGFHLRPEYGGGAILLRNLDDPAKYQGAELADIAVDELTKNKEQTFHLLRGSLRWPGIDDNKFIGGTNPSSNWVRDFWIEKRLPLEMRNDVDKFAFVQALPIDNPYLSSSYWGELNTLPEVLRRSWRDGDWYTSLEGRYFTEFTQNIHGITNVPDLSTMTEIWGSMDYGFNHWNVFQLHCKNGDGIRFTIHEVCHRQHYPSEIAPDIISVLALYGLEPNSIYVYSGPDTFAKTGRAVEGIDDQYRKFGFRFRQWDAAPGSRTTKAHELLRLLGNVERKQPPQWYYVRQNCKRLEQTLPVMVPDPSNPESVKKIDCDESGNGGDDSYDCLVGGITRVKKGGMA